MKNILHYNQDSFLRKVLLREHLFGFLSLLLFVGLVIMAAHPLFQKMKEYKIGFTHQANLPAEKQISKIIDRLEYSGLSMLQENGVKIALNFTTGTWVMRNINHFDKQGNFILDEGKYGTCGELAVYTYNQIKPLLGEDYEVKFVKAAQSEYFLYPIAGHVVLKIAPKGEASQGLTYILDPTFHRYGPIEEFTDYLFQEEMAELPFMQERQKDIELPVGALFPLLIKNKHILGLLVVDNYGKLDRDNYMFSLMVNKKHRYSGKAIFSIRNNNGEEETLEANADLRAKILSAEEYADLKNKTIALFRGVEK